MEPSSRPLYLVCTRKTSCNLLSHIPCGKQVAVQEGNEWECDLIHDDTEVKIDWRKTGMPQHCHLTHPHAITWPCKYVSNNIMLSETYFPIMCMKHNIQSDVPKHAMTILKCKHATTLIISRVQTCLPGSEKSESSSAKFAAPSPPSVSTV